MCIRQVCDMQCIRVVFRNTLKQKKLDEIICFIENLSNSVLDSISNMLIQLCDSFQIFILFPALHYFVFFTTVPKKYLKNGPNTRFL